MKALMSAVAADYPQIELTIFVGDMEQGVAAAKNNFHEIMMWLCPGEVRRSCFEKACHSRLWKLISPCTTCFAL